MADFCYWPKEESHRAPKMKGEKFTGYKDVAVTESHLKGIGHAMDLVAQWAFGEFSASA